jgi:hypothetical protein
MEQIMMADGVTGSLRLNLEKRIEEGTPSDKMETSESKFEDVYEALADAPQTEQQRHNESQLIES